MRQAFILLIVCSCMPLSAVLGEDATASPQPTILLTGFEPFGEGRPPNPSWEGIRQLGGKTWQGYRLVARQLPVVWGSPRKCLEEWIKELQPVAIFSFGQGGGYKLETKAENRRGNAADNDGKRPGDSLVFADGPEVLQATIDARGLVDNLRDMGYRISISEEAGNYLCEECLYTLEYLKQRDRSEIAVLFCHVPPLRKGEYEPADAERFVISVLQSWRDMSAKAK